MSDLPVTAAGALLRRLRLLGIDMVFTNSGTDFPPIIEALAEAHAHDVDVPRLIVVPHEHVAMGMAHGYYAATSRAQAVILHTNVGLANGAIGAINAATEHVPMLIMSGRTPITEHGRFGARTVPIGWGQEMRDQTALVREAVKWDFELRYADQLPTLLDRAYAVANSTPTGPVYLGLPREPLAEPCPSAVAGAPISMQPARVIPPPEQIELVAQHLLGAEQPLIIAQRGAGSAAGFAALGRLSDRYSIPICQYWAVANAVSADHPMYIGQDPSPWIEQADVVLVINSLAPWMPDAHGPSEECTVIQLGPDPLFERFPVRNFGADVSVRGEVGPSLEMLESALNTLGTASGDAAGMVDRRARIERWNTRRRADLVAASTSGNGSPMTKEWVSWHLGKAIEGRTATVVSELGCPLDPLRLTTHDAWYQEPHSGGLGWSFPFAMGMKLGAPGRLVVATMGDGSYLFSNPVACHQVAASTGIPMLVVVLNNGGYGAVRDSVLHMYPSGYAAKADEMPLISIPTPGRLAAVAQACGAHAETVERGDDLPPALERALRATMDNGQLALLEVLVR